METEIRLTDPQKAGFSFMNDLMDKLKSGSGKTLLTVFPHPDDESLPVGGVVVAAKQAGWKVIVVSLTAGGAGKIYVRGNGKSLKEIRREELRRAVGILGADAVVIGDFTDGGLRTETGWKRWVDEVMEEYRPEAVVTYDPSGFYGHPDHIAVSKYMFEQFRRQPNKGGKKWELWFMAVPQILKDREVITGMDQVKAQMVAPTHRLDLGWNWIRKWRAIRAHRSQRLGKSLELPLGLFLAINHSEWYHVVSDPSEAEYKFKYTDYQI